ncbi:hypothetical protein [Streptomyces sp. NPDC057403]|uniref:hypothetical protein n=1 Tax=Streptomyces sp. NPDC057403 TaxID=3346119 RepID=UPI0036B152B5
MVAAGGVLGREELWPRRLEQVVAATRRRAGDPPGWGLEQWRLLMRHAVVFPELAVVAQALLDPSVQELTVRQAAGGLGRDAGLSDGVVAALSERLGRDWLGGVEAQAAPGALVYWAQAPARQRRRPAGCAPRQDDHRYRVWWVPVAHRPAEASSALQQLAASSDRDRAEHAGETGAPACRTELVANPVDRGKKGSKLHVLSDAQGIPLAIAVSGATMHDSLTLKPLILGIPAVRSRRGHGDSGP